MGQTLTHGIYLPDEGERNCYDGLASNWSILDGAVGTVAEHSTQIAGKAPLVHTHTKADITDFPVYGTTAGTICEGNDSRLSDARTPVAHTHTKSDVTDLFNSNFIPSANNSYDLGSSSYQWNNLYAKNYYYNGTAWGLDQDNTWTGANSFYKSIQIHGARNAYIMPEFGASYSGLAFGTIEFKQSFKFGDWVDNNSTIGLNTSNAYVEIYAGLDSSDSVNKARLYPVNTTVAELGTSTNKWKSFNGINPGALSLPDLSISQNVDTTGWVYNGTTLNSVLLNSGDTNVTKNGWLYIRTNNTVAGDRVAVRLKNVTAEDPTTIAGEIGFGHIEIFVPIVAGYQAYVFTNKAPTYIKFYPCLGNVPSGV